MRHEKLNIGVAIDFDGTLFSEGKFPLVGDPIYEMIWFANYLYNIGFQTVIWTLRSGKREKVKEAAVEALKRLNVNYDYWNQTPEDTRKDWGDQRKLGVHYFIDDRNAGGIPDVTTMMGELLGIANKLGYYATNHYGVEELEAEFNARADHESLSEYYASAGDKFKIKHLKNKLEDAERLCEEFKAEIDELQTEIQVRIGTHKVMQFRVARLKDDNKKLVEVYNHK